MPYSDRNYTTEFTDRWIEMYTLYFITLFIIQYLYQITTQKNDILITVGMMMDWYDCSGHQGIQHTLTTIVRTCTQVIIHTETRINQRFIE